MNVGDETNKGVNTDKGNDANERVDANVGLEVNEGTLEKKKKNPKYSRRVGRKTTLKTSSMSIGRRRTTTKK